MYVSRRLLAEKLAVDSELTSEELEDDIGSDPDDYYSDYEHLCEELNIRPLPPSYWRDACVS